MRVTRVELRLQFYSSQEFFALLAYPWRLGGFFSSKLVLH